MSTFSHLHLHTEYSLLDGLNRSANLMEKVKNDGMDSVAITDHGVMYGVPEFWITAKDFGVKPIIGCEVYLAPEGMNLKRDSNGIKYYHLLLLATNKIGYVNLNKIVSTAHLQGYYYKPRIDKETLRKYSEGLICTSACLAGPIARNLIRNQEDKAIEWMNYLKDTFKDNFYLELQRNGFDNDDLSKIKISHLDEEWQETIKHQVMVNNKLKEYSDSNKIELIATTDAHFLNEEDKDTQEILFAIKDGRLLSDPNRRKGYLGTYVKTQEEMKANFLDMPEVLENTLKISEKVEAYDIRFDRIQPKFPDIPKNKTALDELKEQVFEGAKRKYANYGKDLEERIGYELEVIHEKGYDDYFLVVSDIMKWARKQEIVVGVRGSVAGSVVAYCLDIINVEPIKWELYFERFLNPERPSPPDIDMDIQDDRRDEVINYVETKYGKDNVAAICAIGRMKTKAAIRDVARVMGVNLQVADTLSKKVHVIFGKVKKIKDMMNDDPSFAEIINGSPELQILKKNVEKIEGMARHISTHACGYLITPEPITNYLSVQVETKGGEKTITQNEGAWIEELGLMKFDFLGLRNLTIIKNTLDFIEKYHNKKISVDEIPETDKKTFELFGRGETIGVFQFESPPMQKYLRKLQPETLEDLCFMVSAYRPGPMKYIPDYIDRKHGQQETTYLIPEMEPILAKTFGFAIYQEQVIKIAVELAGYSMGQADLLRRAMGKKKHDVMAKEEPKFKKGITDKGYNKKIADQIWEYLLPFADYGFNKAHGAGYALIAYWCAYLKSNFPIEFIAGLMHSDINDNDRIVIDMEEAKSMGYKILPPDINHSGKYFTIEGGGIRFGLGAIKNVSDKGIDMIVKERIEGGEFVSLDDLIERVGCSNLNKKTIECLIMVGAMDTWGGRNQLLSIVQLIWDRVSRLESSKQGGQTDLFGDLNENVKNASNITPLPFVSAETPQQKITWERELIGTYVTEHPLTSFRHVLLSGVASTLEDAANMPEGSLISVLTSISEIKILRTKRDNKEMAFLKLEDLKTKAEAIVFPKTYEKIVQKLIEFQPLILKGRTSFREDKFSLMVEEVSDPNDNQDLNKLKIDITNIKDRLKIENLKKAILSNPGEMELEIIYGTMYSKKSLVKKIDPNQDLISILSDFRV